MKKEYLEGGRFCSAHGVRGVIKAEAWCDSPAVLTRVKKIYLKCGDGYTEMEILGASVSAQFVLLTLSGIDSREAAQAMKNTVFYLKREDVPVPVGRVLIADMIGLDVIDADSGRIYGTLTDVTDGVKNQLYTIKTATGEVLFPAVKEFLKEIDIERGIFIRPIPGFFEDEI